MIRYLPFILLVLVAWTPAPDPPGTPPVSVMMTKAEALEIVAELSALPQVTYLDTSVTPPAVPPAVSMLVKLQQHLEYLLYTPNATSVTLY